LASDALNCRARAEVSPDGRHYILNGEKMWITNAGFADLFTVFARSKRFLEIAKNQGRTDDHAAQTC